MSNDFTFGHDRCSRIRARARSLNVFADATVFVFAKWLTFVLFEHDFGARDEKHGTGASWVEPCKKDRFHQDNRQHRWLKSPS